MLHLGIDVLFVIWSTTIGKIVSGHSLDSRFFFLVIFPFVASPFILSFFWKVCICSAKGDTPLDPHSFSPSFLSFASLYFSFSCLCFKFFSFCEISILFCFFDRAYWASRAVHVHNRNYRPGIRWMQLSNYWAKNVFFCVLYIQVVHICPKHVLAKRGEYASAYGAELRSPSSRLPQYKRLAALGHKIVTFFWVLCQGLFLKTGSKNFNNNFRK